MRPTPGGVVRASGLAAMAAGLMFVAIQPLHPADTLEATSTDAWALIHYATLVMLALFQIGIVGIWARQVTAAGWLGLVGLAVLSLGLVLTAFGGVIEALVHPLLADRSPEFVTGMLEMVEGRASDADLGPIPAIWNLASASFLLGTITFGAASWRANVVSRWASGIFAVGLLASAPVVGLLGLPRLAAVPIGIGLAWMGYSVWAERRASASAPKPDTAISQPDALPAA